MTITEDEDHLRERADFWREIADGLLRLIELAEDGKDRSLFATDDPVARASHNKTIASMKGDCAYAFGQLGRATQQLCHKVSERMLKEFVEAGEGV